MAHDYTPVKVALNFAPASALRLRPEVAHRRSHIFVPHPQLNRRNRHTSIRVPRAERGSKLVKPELAVVQPCSLRDSLARLQHFDGPEGFVTRVNIPPVIAGK